MTPNLSNYIRTGDAKIIGIGRQMEGRRKDGSIFPMDFAVSEMRLGDQLLFVGVVSDITEKKQAEEELQRSNEKNRALINAIPDVMFRVSGDGVFFEYTATNNVAMSIPPQAFIGKRAAEVLPADVAALCISQIAQALRTNEVLTLVYQLATNEKVLDYEARIAVSGQDEVLLIVRDISERLEVERIKEKFISVVSHELRTPLTSIRGSLGLMAGGVLGALPEKAQHMMVIAANNTDRLVRLINDILDIERMESGKAIMEKHECDVASLVNQATEVMQSMADKAEVLLSASCQTAQIWADSDRIIQVLTNLISNAIKFSPRGSTISISTETQEDRILFKVEDQGRGAPPDKLESVFGRFQQVDGSDSREKGGTGLGLAIIQKMVEQHDGEIWVESTPGEGSAFYFSLPPTMKVTSSDALAITSERPLVLVCDDDAFTLETVRALLDGSGLDMIAVTSGGETVQIAATRQPDVILLDVIMPDMDGLEAATALKERADTKDIPIIILSALSPEQSDDLPQNVSKWVQKPLDAQSLFNALERVIGRADRSPRIMVVEDDSDMAEILTTMFNRHNIETFHARTGNQAIEFSQTVMPDLLVLDLALPEADGYEVVEWLRKHNRLRKMPLVVYTAKDLDEFDRDRLKLGQTYFFTKGRISPEDFESRVIGLIDRVIPHVPHKEGVITIENQANFDR